MYINTFKYSPQDVSCQLCTEYVKKVGCTALRCPWLAERIEAGVVGYREAIMLIKHFHGSLWSNEQHVDYTVLNKASGILIDAWAGVPVAYLPPVNKLRIAEYSAKQLRNAPVHFGERRSK